MLESENRSAEESNEQSPEIIGGSLYAVAYLDNLRAYATDHSGPDNVSLFYEADQAAARYILDCLGKIINTRHAAKLAIQVEGVEPFVKATDDDIKEAVSGVESSTEEESIVRGVMELHGRIQALATEIVSDLVSE